MRSGEHGWLLALSCMLVMCISGRYQLYRLKGSAVDPESRILCMLAKLRM